MMTVVGLLIAGEIYIHFSNKDVQKAKMTELLKAIKKSVPQVRLPDSMGSVQGGLDNDTCFVGLNLRLNELFYSKVFKICLK